MKSNKSICKIVSFALSCLLFVVISCSKDESPIITDNGELVISTIIKSGSFLQTKAANTDSIDAILITIESGGVEILTLERIDVFRFGNSFLSAPITLPIGNYTITQFLVVNENDDILYATPLVDSPLEGAVQNALPIEFIIEGNETSNLIAEVLRFQNITPSDFGYTSFNIHIVETFDFLISVFTFNENEVYLTDAELTISNNGQILYTDELEEGTNVIKLPYNYTQFLVELSNSSSFEYSKVFSRDSLQHHLFPDSIPLSVVLIPIPNGLVLWNKLGSETEALNSEFGSNFISPLRSEIYFDRPGPKGFGNGIRTEGGTVNNTGGYLEMAADDFYPADKTKGTVEVWIKKHIPYPMTSNHGLENVFGRVPYGGGYRSISATWCDCEHDGVQYFGGIAFGIFDGDNINHSAIDFDFSSVCTIDTWYHMAFVWDINGINGTDDILRVYRDNILVASNNDVITNKTIYPSNEILKILGHHQYPRMGYSLLELDNIKVWSITKTNFSDRFENWSY